MRGESYRDVVLLGMGGSRLGPEVLRCTFGSSRGWLRGWVLDSTVPGAVRQVTGAIHSPAQEAMAGRPWRNAEWVSAEASAKADMLRRIPPKKSHERDPTVESWFGSQSDVRLPAPFERLQRRRPCLASLQQADAALPDARFERSGRGVDHGGSA